MRGTAQIVEGGKIQMAEVAVTRELFAQILDKIERLKLVPDTG